MIARIAHRHAHSPGRRLVDFLRGLFVGGVGKSQRVYFVNVNGTRYKRVVFGDSALAAEAEAGLTACSSHVGLPTVILHHENELWVSFVEGRKVDPDSDTDRIALADFFAGLYRIAPRQVDLGQTAFHARLLTDLTFLSDAGILDAARSSALLARAEALKPSTIWLGYDYIDPVLKNFVINDDRLIAIDIESIGRDQPLGTVIAKSTLHWLEDGRDRFADLLIERGAPDFRAQLDYVHLCFLAGWTKRKLLTGKRGRIRPQRFDRFC